MKAFNQFMRSKIGKIAIGVILLLVVIAIVVGGRLGTGGLTGTAGLPPNGYTCLPTCDEKDAKMFVLAGSDQSNMSDMPIKVWIMVPGDQTTFTLGVFDGDTSKGINNTLALDVKKNFKFNNGNWDDALSDDTTYTLYADPLADGTGTQLTSWLGNAVMLNNAWWDTTITTDDSAKAPNGNFYYRLEASRPATSKGGQGFKVRASGYLMTGLRQEWPVGLSAKLSTLKDVALKPNYTGGWQLYFNVMSDVQKIEIWDADFDRSGDTDDPNTTIKPTWTNVVAVDEGIGANSSQLDDSKNTTYTISPSAFYEVLDPSGQSICVNDNPSGSREWEDFIISSDPADNPDCLVSAPLNAGMYSIRITGLDFWNQDWFSVNYPICDIPENGGCPPMPNE